MTDYWQYKAVHYWMNIVRNKRAFCTSADFFRMVAAVLPRERGISALWERVPREVLHELQNCADLYRERLNLNGDYARIWFVLWNNQPTREAVREMLLEAAEDWLYAAERGGVGNVPASPPGAQEEADLCVQKGLLFPPDPYVLPEERSQFVQLATSQPYLLHPY